MPRQKGTDMKTAIIAVVALAVGAAGAALLAQQRFSVELDDISSARDEALRQLTKAEALAEKAAGRIVGLERESDSLRDQIAELTRPSELDVPAEPAVEPLAAEILGEELLPAGAEEEPRRRGGWRDREPTEEERAAWQERRETFRQEMRQRVDDFFDDEYAAAPTTEAQERVAQVKEDIDYMIELRDAMRNAETNEERDEIRDEMMQTGMELRDLVVAQQDDMLRSVAENFGIESTEQQDAFITTIRGVQSSPYFQPERYMGGMGRGRPGGFGGRRPPGGPPPGGPPPGN